MFENTIKYLPFFIGMAGIWTLANGILHDIFVLLKHRTFDKELIRLLIDGNILIFSGILLLLCYNGIKLQLPLAYLVSITVCIFVLSYCLLIFKILPSFVTMFIHAITLGWLIAAYRHL
jgi:hypothetical protein